MRLSDILRLVVSHLMNRGLRSWLTVLGVVVGVTAVVAIVSMGEGMEKSVTERFSTLGVDTITITPGYSTASGRGFGQHGGGFRRGGMRSGNLTKKDAMLLKTIPNVKYVGGAVSKSKDVTYLAETASITIRGVDTRVWELMTGSEIDVGRFLEQGDDKVAVLGNQIASGLFSRPTGINQQINVEGQNFKIVGILKPSALGREDSIIFVPLDAARDIMDELDPDQYSSITVKAEEGTNMTLLASDAEKKLLISHQISSDKKDFTIRNPQGIQERMAEITQTMTQFLEGIAAVSLLVGGIGIANTMFMSVMERTRQIGILKALGTTNGEVMKIFLIEAALMGLVGGVLGVLLGMITAGMITEFGISVIPGRPVATVIPPSLIVFALLFSLIIGTVAGILPARRAANLQPVEALRYE